MATGMHYGASKAIFQYAEVLRKKMTIAEKIIWERLCKNQLGVRIRRQHPVWKYVADYYCHEVKLVIEIDGGIHLLKENKEYDIGREITLNEFGIEIIRFTNDQVINETEHVIKAIIEKITELKKHKSKTIINEEKLSKSPLGDLGAGADGTKPFVTNDKLLILMK
jgi:cyclase